MSGRGLLILAVLAALAVAGVVLVRQPETVPGPAEEARFLPALAGSLDRVTAVAVRAPDGSRLARLRREPGGWVVENRHDYPADPQTLRGTLIGLAEARRLEPKSDRAAGHARLGVADPGSGPGSGLELALEGLDSPLAVLIGERAPGDIDATYARRSDSARAWLVSGELERHERIDDWLDDRLVHIPAVRVHRVRLEAVDGAPVRVLLPSPDAPRFEILGIPEGRRALSRTLSKSIARGVAELRLADVVPARGAELPPPLAVARFETFDGLVIRIEIFAADRDAGSRHRVRLQAGTAPGAGDAVRSEAERLNRRYDGWLYEIPHYKLVNLSHTLDTVLAPADGG